MGAFSIYACSLEEKTVAGGAFATSDAWGRAGARGCGTGWGSSPTDAPGPIILRGVCCWAMIQLAASHFNAAVFHCSQSGPLQPLSPCPPEGSSSSSTESWLAFIAATNWRLFSGGTAVSSTACARNVGGVLFVTCVSLEYRCTSSGIGFGPRSWVREPLWANLPIVTTG